MNVLFPGHAHLTYYTFLHRGSYMTGNDLLTLLNELGKRDNMWGLPSIFLFSQD